MELMDLYIDKENVESLMKEEDKGSIRSCAELVREGMNVHYNFSRRDFHSSENIRLWLQMTKGEGVQGETSFSEKDSDIIPRHPVRIKDFGPSGEGEFDAVYLLNKESQSEEVIKHNCILIGSVGDELKVLKKIGRLGKSYEMFLKSIGSWQDYCEEACQDFPLTDIVLVDPYYLSDIDVYLNNDNGIIRVLARSVHGYPVSVVIVTNKNHIDKDISLDDVVKEIRKLLIEETKGDKCYVSIVAHPKIYECNLVTNYFCINSGQGFNILQAGISDGSCVRLKSNANGYNFTFVNYFINRLKKKIKSIEEGKSTGFITGDKVSNYFEFRQ